MEKIKTRDIVAYVALPQFVPRVRSFFTSGFGYVAFLMAQIYAMVKLLPAHHPYLQPENIGRFGIHHVIAAATQNLRFSRNHIDQILIYFAMLSAIAVLVAQILTLLCAILVPTAMAFSWFDIADPSEDIAYNILDRVFGVPDIFCSSFSPANCTNYATNIPMNTPGPANSAAIIPLPYHSALQGLFRFYSMALLLVAVLIFLYFVVVVVVETAVTGTPFGQRFQNVWVPVRLVVALGLLVPLNFGLGSGQYIVLYAAKYGSSFATNGWSTFNQGVTSHRMFNGTTGNPVGERYTFLAIPEMPDITPIIESMSLVHACAYSYHRIVAGQENVTTGFGNYPEVTANYSYAARQQFKIQPYLVKEPTRSMSNGRIGITPLIGSVDRRRWIPDETSVSYLDALGFYFGHNIVIRFGEHRTSYTNDTGYVKPLCGDIIVPVNNLSDPGGAGAGRGGADYMLRFYYETVLYMWFSDLEMRQFARASVSNVVSKGNGDGTNTVAGLDVCAVNSLETGANAGGHLAGLGSAFGPGAFQQTPEDCRSKLPAVDWKTEMIRRYTLGTGANDGLRPAIVQAWSDYVVNSTFADFTADLEELGWGGAGIWYNKLAEINGGWIDGVKAIPYMGTYPLVMEQVRTEKQQVNEAEGWDIFNPTLKGIEGRGPIKFMIGRGEEELEQVAEPLATVYAYWNKDPSKNPDNLDRLQLQNIFLTGMSMLLGADGLMAMRTSNQHLHPLAQLVAVGKGLVDSAVFDMASSSATAFLGGMLKAMGKARGLAEFSEAISQVFLSLSFMGLTAGFVLFYVLPFLPFIYFYFAVASWVKTIFEAMVGVPLWALAHLRIDGDGLPGDAAQNGYFLILEIFIRPILTVVGLIAAVGIFSTQVRLLNFIWDLVIVNAAGFTPEGDILGMEDSMARNIRRSIIDQFFFTIVYTIICYMMALASFKLIDKIPDNILRWAGAGVSSFGDIDQESIESISRYATVGGMTIGSQAAGAIRDAAGGVGSLAGQAAKGVTGGGKGQGGAGNAGRGQGGGGNAGRGQGGAGNAGRGQGRSSDANNSTPSGENG